MCTFHLLSISFYLLTSGSNFSSGFSSGGSAGLMMIIIPILLTVKRVNFLLFLHRASETNGIIIFFFDLRLFSLFFLVRVNTRSTTFGIWLPIFSALLLF
jgi:hypothetical protein